MATFLLIHGACHGGWSWAQITPLLQAQGHTVVAPDLPCDVLRAGLREYADHARGALEEAPGDLVVVGHSLGALTASVLSSSLPIRRLTFVAGIIGVLG